MCEGDAGVGDPVAGHPQTELLLHCSHLRGGEGGDVRMLLVKVSVETGIVNLQGEGGREGGREEGREGGREEGRKGGREEGYGKEGIEWRMWRGE